MIPTSPRSNAFIGSVHSQGRPSVQVVRSPERVNNVQFGSKPIQVISKSFVGSGNPLVQASQRPSFQFNGRPSIQSIQHGVQLLVQPPVHSTVQPAILSSQVTTTQPISQFASQFAPTHSAFQPTIRPMGHRIITQPGVNFHPHQQHIVTPLSPNQHPPQPFISGIVNKSAK